MNNTTEYNDRISIIIPAYKDVLSEFELISLQRCFKVLRKYDIIIVTHKDVNLDKYKQEASLYNKKIHIEFFDSKYFKNLLSYNSLMMNSDFYTRFKHYKYMLIYQLDCYVFNDDLESWCNKNYDYIGAPWFKDFKYEKGYSVNDIIGIGNGGFSLRKIKYFIDAFSSTQRVFSIKTIAKMIKIKEISIIRGLLLIFGYNNHFKDFCRYHINRLYEDQFFCLKLKESRFSMKMPDINESIKFSFEQGPSLLFDINNKKLPFGCHAFEKNEFEKFWNKYIPVKFINI
jgi:hypothetical protein